MKPPTMPQERRSNKKTDLPAPKPRSFDPEQLQAAREASWKLGLGGSLKLMIEDGIIIRNCLNPRMKENARKRFEANKKEFLFLFDNLIRAQVRKALDEYI